MDFYCDLIFWSLGSGGQPFSSRGKFIIFCKIKKDTTGVPRYTGCLAQISF
jgi:hypothetical protein